MVDAVSKKLQAIKNRVVGNKSSQLELEIIKKKEPDRNHMHGGRSFYFFDFDDNVAFLTTKIFIFHKETGAEVALSSGVYAEHSRYIGKSGEYKDYEMNFNDEVGSFRLFRDVSINKIQKFLGYKQPFIEDLAHALGFDDFHWKGPSWSCFYHAVFNMRPISVITARGHHPETIKEGIRLFLKAGHLNQEPNYLSLYPVSHPQVIKELGFSERASVAEMKRAAIRQSVLQAFKTYGESDYHRFGMSDDDPKNIELITQEMIELKKEFPKNSFFVVKTTGGDFIKREVFADGVKENTISMDEQLQLFNNPTNV